MKALYLWLVFALCATSAHAQSLDPAAAALRTGESINGFPSWSERVLLEWINRARVDPQADLAGCGAACPEASCYKPVAPLSWSEALNRSARFHADEMGRQGYFAHDSKCHLVENIDSLYPAGCDGSASCACNGGASTCANGCTPWGVRVAMFGAGPSGEIMAGTAEPNYAFYLWLYEPSTVSACGATGANLHRWLILQSAGAVGLGAARYAVGDFGGAAAEPYRIPSAAHYPQQADRVDLWANWYDASAPKAANAVVDGRCTSMSLKRGTKQNGAWTASATGVGSGCHRYYFSFIDSTGAEVTYPVTGSLGIGCEDWNSSRVVAKCGTTSTPAPARRRSVRRGR